MLTVTLELTEIDVETLQKMYTDAADDLNDVLRSESDNEDTDDFWNYLEDLKDKTQVLKKLCYAIEGLADNPASYTMLRYLYSDMEYPRHAVNEANARLMEEAYVQCTADY